MKYEEIEEKLEKFRIMAKEKICNLEAEKENYENDFNVHLQQRDDHINELKERNSELEKELFNENREDSLGELEVECEKLHGIVENLKTENERLLTKMSEIESDKTTTESLSNVQSQLEVLIDERNKLISQRDILEENHNNMFAQQSEKLQNVENERDALKDEIENLRGELDTSKVLQKVSNTDESDQSSQIDELWKNIKQLENDRDHLISERNSLSQNYQSIQVKLSQIVITGENDRAKHLEVVEKLQQEKNELDAILQNEKNKNNSQLKALNQLAEQMDTNTDEIQGIDLFLGR